MFIITNGAVLSVISHSKADIQRFSLQDYQKLSQFFAGMDQQQNLAFSDTVMSFGQNFFCGIAVSIWESHPDYLSSVQMNI